MKNTLRLCVIAGLLLSQIPAWANDDSKWQGRIGIEATDAEWMATLIKR